MSGARKSRGTTDRAGLCHWNTLKPSLVNCVLATLSIRNSLCTGRLKYAGIAKHVGNNGKKGKCIMSGVETRNIARDSLLLLADVRVDGAPEDFRIKVRNLSAGGMMAEGSMPVVPGQHVQINLRHIGWVPGTVAWVQGDRCGVAFTHQIDPKQVRATGADAPQDRQIFINPAKHLKAPAQPDPAALRKI